MCGIAGIQGHIPPGAIDVMNASQAHRGPDGQGSFEDRDAGIALGHVRLSILDLTDAASQPMYSPDGRYVIVFNGEIYNFRELREPLQKAGYTFRTRSDTEVLLYGLMHHGPDYLTRLNGIYALALWDKTKRELLLTRDGLGIKPLYIAPLQDTVLFASELKTLLAPGLFDPEIDMVALSHYLTYLWCPTPRTPIRQVQKLAPGKAVVIRGGKIVGEWYHYRLPQGDEAVAMPPTEAIQNVRRQLRTAVHRQMVSDVPVGAFLSGGLDSSAVVAFAREMAGQQLQCFTIDLDVEDARHDGMTSDLPYAEKTARHLGVALHTVRVGPEMADELASMLYYLDEPQADPAPLNALFISRLARCHGIKVLLSGAGGDDIFSGYRRHRALLLERYWSWLPRSIRKTLLANTAGLLPLRPASLRRLSKAFQYADLDGDERMASYFYWLSPPTVHDLFTEEARAGIIAEQPLLASLQALPAGTPPINRMLHLECKHFLADHNLNYTDKMGMAAGVEVRVPFLDPDVVELASKLPPEYKQRGREGKWILKKAMEGILPNDIIYRPKTGFGAPVRAWLHGPLRNLVGDILSPHALRQRGWFDPGRVTALIEADRAGRLDAAYTIFSLLCVELWSQMFIDTPAGARQRLDHGT